MQIKYLTNIFVMNENANDIMVTLKQWPPTWSAELQLMNKTDRDVLTKQSNNLRNIFFISQTNLLDTLFPAIFNSFHTLLLFIVGKSFSRYLFHVWPIIGIYNSILD